MAKLLSVDDDSTFSEEIVEYFRNHGFEAIAQINPKRALEQILRGEFDIVLIDQYMPTLNGLDLLHKIRETTGTPCIFLTGFDDKNERIAVLEAGADDYIVKTTPAREILARTRAVLRRGISRNFRREQEFEACASNKTEPRSWRLLSDVRDLQRPDGSLCRLTGTEFGLLEVLVRAQGRIVSREELCTSVFQRPYRNGDRSPDMIVARLRRYLESDLHRPTVIKSVRNLGYVFTEFPATWTLRKTSSSDAG